MTKLKTLFLLFLAGFILVGCSDPRADDKKMLVSMLIVNQDLSKDQAECAVNALSDEMEDIAWESLMLSINGSYIEMKALEDTLSKEEQRDVMQQLTSGMAATLQCDGVDRSMF
tara:strand:+ start:180 stop:521 length:342 start_codon:yes stop_codon:yes gene_type:complete